jgi:transcriptional regulator with XRE-family HTH domain
MKKQKPPIKRIIQVEVFDKDLVWSQIGANVANARKLQGLTQEQLARIIHLSRTSIVNLEMGNQRCPLDTLYDISGACGISIQELLP